MKLLILILVLFLILFLRNYQSTFSSVDYKSYLNELYLKFKNRFKLNNNTSTLEGIDMVYVVVMPERVDYITKQINSMNLRCKYFDAVKKTDLSDSDVNLLSNTNEPGSRMYKIKTRLCHLLSFTMCFIDALQNGYSTICIFEDDIIINVDLKTINQGTSEFVKSGNDVFYMGYCFLDCKQRKTNGKFISELSDKQLLCNHSACFKTKMLPDLIDYSFKMTLPTDETFTNYFKKMYFISIIIQFILSYNIIASSPITLIGCSL
jgi:GR25 family glycosyltransferase involved in LPS biosynthesis